jgi:ATPase subunit of ABC transporter with duplicated ATPase domains
VLDHAVVQRGSFRLGPVDLQVDWGDRIVITGPNGSGKTTLLAALLGEVELASGRTSLGSGVVVGGIDQARLLIDEDETLPLAFARLLPDAPDADVRPLLAQFGLLVLDEPTNHLDLPAIEQLEQALATYPGTMLLVSHDRRLLDAVQVNRRLSVEHGTVREA